MVLLFFAFTDYLTPIWKYKPGTPLNRYYILDYYELDPAKGTEEDFKHFVETAHTGPDRYIYENHRDWILRDKYGNLVYCWPNKQWGYAVDRANPEVIEYFTEIAKYYVDEFGIDGWRMDAIGTQHCNESISDCPQPVEGERHSKYLLESIKSALEEDKSLHLEWSYLGLRTTSNPYKSDEAYQNVTEYIDKAARYGYSYVAVMLCWYRMDTTKHETFPEPEDIGKLMDWEKLDEIFDYAKSKNVYIIPLFWHNVPPQWWFDLTPNYEDFLQTSDKGEIVPMMSFNVPDFQKYEDEAIKAVINRYKNHPAYLGFLLQFGYSNEDNYPGAPYVEGWFDYSTFAKQRFREWLKERYNHDVSSLQEAWGNFSVNFENAEPPKPLPDITNPTEMVDWINGGGDSRRQFYDWQLFRLEEKRRARDHLIEVVKGADPHHALIMTSPSVGDGSILFINSMALDYDEYFFSPKVDIVHINPGIHKTWHIVDKAGKYAFVKYFETRGKEAFIKWESRCDLPPDNVEELKKRAVFARETGSGMALWENEIQGFPEFTDEQIRAAAEAFHSTPEGKLKRSKFAIVDNTFSNSFDYRKGKGNLKMYSHFKLADRAMLRGLLYSAGLDFDIITTNEIIRNPDILKNYRAIALSNLYRMSDELLDILVDYRNSGGGLFIQGRTGLYDKYGERETKYLKQLLGINSTIWEYKGTDYSWTYSDADEPMLKDISGRQGDKKSKYNMYYIPVFDYQKEGYEVLGYLDENPEIATVGYKGKVVFWFPRLGMQFMDLNEEELEITEQFLRNLYDFYGIQSPGIEEHKKPEVEFMNNSCLFKNSVLIRFKLTKKERVSLKIYDGVGRLVRTLLYDSFLNPGTYEFIWDGKDNRNRKVPSAVYFCTLEAKAERVLVKKMIFLK